MICEQKTSSAQNTFTSCFFVSVSCLLTVAFLVFKFCICISLYIQNRTYLPHWYPNSYCQQSNNPIYFALGRCQYVVPLTCMAAYTYIIYTILEMKKVPEHVKEIYITKSHLWVLRYFFVIWHIISSSWDVVSQGVHSVAPTQLHLLRCRAGPCAVKVPCAMPWKNFWRTMGGNEGQTCRECRSRKINMDAGN